MSNHSKLRTIKSIKRNSSISRAAARKAVKEVCEYRQGDILSQEEIDNFLKVAKSDRGFDEEKVNHQKHYAGKSGKHEVIAVIEDWQLNFNLGNAVKYIARCEHKGNKKEDLEKAIFYLQYELEGLDG